MLIALEFVDILHFEGKMIPIPPDCCDAQPGKYYGDPVGTRYGQKTPFKQGFGPSYGPGPTKQFPCCGGQVYVFPPPTLPDLGTADTSDPCFTRFSGCMISYVTTPDLPHLEIVSI